jgi:hypothetical protein
MPAPNIGNYTSKYDDIIVRASKEAGIDPNVLRSLHYTEDASDDPNAISPHGAVGLDQMKPDTFTHWADKGASITDPEENITASARLVKKLIADYNGDMFKVYAAYNLGHYDENIPKDGIAYAKQAQANLADLENRAAGKPPDKKSTFTVKVLPKAADKGKQDQNILDAEAQADMDTINTIGNIAGKAVVPAEVFTRYMGTEAWKKLPKDDQEKLTKMVQTAPAQYALGGVGTVAQMVASVPSLADAALRGNEDLGEFGKDFIKALRDPAHARQIMAALNAKYTPFGGPDQAYWVTRPGILSKGAIQTNDPVQVPLQAAASIYATISQGVFDMPHVRDLLAFGVGWFNPANKVPGLLVGAGGKLVKAGVRAAVEDTSTLGQSHREAKAAYTHWVSKMPMGDRFYKTKVNAADHAEAESGKKWTEEQKQKFGEQAAAVHAEAARKMAASPGVVTDVFLQGNKGGGGIVPGKDDHTILMYHDKLYNDTFTAHVHDPHAGGTLHVDPHTKALVMQRGGKLDAKSYADHLEYAHVNNEIRPKEIKNWGELFPTGPTGPHFKAFKEAMKNGDITTALMQYEHSDLAEVKALAQHIDTQTAGMTKSQIKAFKDTSAKMYLAGIESRRLSSGGTVVPVFVRMAKNPGEVPGPKEGKMIYGHDMDTVARDHTPLGDTGVTVDERTFQTTMAKKHLFDDPIEALAPRMAAKMREGIFPRGKTAISPGLFEKEPKPGDPKQPDQQKAGGGLMNTMHRNYDSIAEAITAGEEINKKASPYASMINQANKSNMLAHYLQYMLPHLKDIDYKEATAGIVMLGVGPTKGLAGKENMMKAVAEQAEKTVGTRYGSNWGARKATEEGKKEVTNETARLMKRIQAQWESKNTRWTWNTDQLTKVDDFEGKMLPKYIVDAAHDIHPAFQDKGMNGDILADPTPEHKLQMAVDLLNGLTRNAFMSVLPYHIIRNVSALAFEYGYLAPQDIARGFIAPHDVDPRLLKMAEDHGLTWRFRGAPGLGITSMQIRQATNDKFAGKPNMNQYQNLAETPKRMKAILDAHNRLNQGRKLMAEPTFWSPLLSAYYHGDKFAQDTVFGIHEDAFTAMALGKLLQRGYSPERAAREVRKVFGDRENITAGDKVFQRNLWFFNWFKTQMRQGFQKAYNPRTIAMGGAVNAALYSQDSNNPDNQETSRQVQYGEMDDGIDPKTGIQRSTQVEPPTMGYSGAAQGIIEGIGQSFLGDPAGFMNFDQFTKTHLQGQVAVQFRPLIDSAKHTWDLGPNGPTVPKSNSQVFDDEVQGVAKAATPQLATAMADVANDPLANWNELTGFRNNMYQPGPIHVARTGMIQLWKGRGRGGGFEQLYYAAGNDPQKQQAVLQMYEKAAKPYIDMLEKAKPSF